MSETLKIFIQETPNPNALKFVLNRTVAAQGQTYRDAAAAEAEWAKQLLVIKGVAQVFALQNFISLTKLPEGDWEVIVPEAERVLKQAFAG